MGFRVDHQARLIPHQGRDVLRVPGLTQDPIACEQMDLRRDPNACKGALAEDRADRRHRYDGTNTRVREVRDWWLVLPTGSAVAAESGVLVATKRAVARENAHVRPAADQREHAIAAGRVPDGADAGRVDAGSERGVVEKPIQHRA